MKNKIKKLVFYSLFAVAVCANFKLLTNNEGADTHLYSFSIQSAASDTENPGIPAYLEYCRSCTDQYGQNGMQFWCDYGYSYCEYEACHYGYC